MTTNDERREVAWRLRDMSYDDTKESLICAYLDALGIKGYADWVEIAHRLADLIEPSGYECVPGECPLNVRHDNDLIEPKRTCYYYDSETNRCGCYDIDLIDRERLLAIATMMAADSVRAVKQEDSVSPVYILHAARNIAEACGETFGSIRNRELDKWGTSIVPKETIVDRDALLALADELDESLAWIDGDEPVAVPKSSLRDASRRIREACGMER